MSQSAACCSVPAVVAKDYSEKGNYTTVAGLKTYQTGDSSAKAGILVVYDIFGFFPQTIQGADILAHGDKERPYQVFIPDFFKGSPTDISWYPPQTEEHKKKLGEFFSTTADIPKNLKTLDTVMSELKKSNPSITSWATIGYCWGGKVVNLASQSGSHFKVGAAAHPAMIDPSDAAGLTIPYALLASKDEDKEAIQKWQSEIKVKHIVEIFPDQVHGFMAARADLEDAKVKQEYERGYKLVLDFFHEHL